MNASDQPAPLACVILGAGTPWVYALGEALARAGHFVHVVAPYDLGNYRRLRPTWPPGEPSANLRRNFWVLPPGYAGRLEPVFRPLLRWRTRRALKAVRRAAGGAAPWLIVPYPWFEEIARVVPAARLAYYNLDDYVLYQPERAAAILCRETRLLDRAALTLCLSQTQVEALRARCPRRSDAIRHFPLGVVEKLLNPQPDTPPRPNVVGYVGNLIDRVDWRLVREVARAMPDVEFVFVGGLDGFSGGGARPNWQSERENALSLPNVRAAGRVPQEDVYRFYWECAVNWIPYATDHAFNRAACPTKIMDALAAGRPVVSTNVPECRLYPEWITIADTAPELAVALRRALAGPTDADSARRQVGFARTQTWRARAETLETWLRNATD